MNQSSTPWPWAEDMKRRLTRLYEITKRAETVLTRELRAIVHRLIEARIRRRYKILFPKGIITSWGALEYAITHPLPSSEEEQADDFAAQRLRKSLPTLSAKQLLLLIKELRTGKPLSHVRIRRRTHIPFAPANNHREIC